MILFTRGCLHSECIRIIISINHISLPNVKYEWEEKGVIIMHVRLVTYPQHVAVDEGG